MRRTLGLWDLIFLGIGSIMGTGVFVLTGKAAVHAGPGVMVSFVLAAVCAGLSAMCYAEMAGMLPISGGVAVVADMLNQLANAGMSDSVTFASLNVFGRTMGPKWKDGRTHNGNHHVGLIIGSKIQGSVIGGVQPMTSTAGDGRTLSFDPTTGQGSSGGSIVFEQTMASYGKSISSAPKETLEQAITMAIEVRKIDQIENSALRPDMSTELMTTARDKLIRAEKRVVVLIDEMISGSVKVAEP